MSLKRKFKRNNISVNNLPCERKCGVCHGKMQLKEVGKDFEYICGCGRVKKEKTATCCKNLLYELL